MAVDSIRGIEAVRARGVSRPWRLVAGAFLAGSLLVGLGVGPVGIGATGILESALSHLPFLHVHSPLSSLEEAVLWQIRAPRVVLAAIVGGMLAIAGSAYQGVFHNSLADPYLLGVAAGSGLGATLAITYGHVGCRSPRSSAGSPPSRLRTCSGAPPAQHGLRARSSSRASR